MSDARIVCPYTRVHPRTRQALDGWGDRVEMVPMDGPTAYAELFARLAEEARTTVIVEHDVVPTRSQLMALLECGHLWCGWSYNDPSPPRISLPPPPAPAYLGCMRFDGRLLGRLRGLYDGVPERYRHWRNVDYHVAWCAGELTDCVSHGGPVEHHHAWAYGQDGGALLTDPTAWQDPATLQVRGQSMVTVLEWRAMPEGWEPPAS